MEADVLDEWISVSEAAKRAGCTKRAINYWITDGKVRGRRIGNIWIVSQVSLAQLLKGDA